MDLKPTALMSCIALVFVVILPLFIIQFFRQRKKQDALDRELRQSAKRAQLEQDLRAGYSEQTHGEEIWK